MAGNNNLKRDEVEAWKDQNIWTQIDKAVHDEVKRIRVATKVFLPRPLINATTVSADEVNLASMTIAEGPQLPFLEISRTFSLTPTQVAKEPELRTAVTLARLAATEVAMAEERLLFQGQNPNPALPLEIRILNRDRARGGLLGAADGSIPVAQSSRNPRGVYGEEIFTAVSAGISLLLGRGQPGPYALFLTPVLFADSYRPLENTLIAPADRVIPLVPGGFYASVGMQPNIGLMASLGGEPTTLVVSQDTVTAFTQQDAEEGLYRFRVFERIQFIARDSRALLRLEYQQ